MRLRVDEGLEWESFAQLPHGVEQIKEHLLTQDNVPLLVHIYTHAQAFRREFHS